LEFRSYVILISSVGRVLGRVSPKNALELLVRNATVEESRRGRVCSIRLKPVVRPVKPPTPLSVSSYLGQRYVFTEALESPTGESVARCYSLKEIHPDDRSLFVDALADVCKAEGK
jgi:hypothetical protein